MKIGSLFSGIGGLELGLEAHGHETIWHSEIDPHASKVLTRHWDVPNLGDVAKVDWDDVESPDLLCGGFPCQDLSYAGKGAGIKEGTRSGLWFEFARAIRDLRPRVCLVENVSALLARGVGIVLGDLAEAGYDARWFCLRASDVGAPHRRERLFLLAYSQGNSRRFRYGDYLLAPNPDRGGFLVNGERNGRPHEPGLEAPRGHDSDGRDEAFADSALDGLERPRQTRNGWSGSTHTDWGAYEPAIRRWEALTRPAPNPTINGKLSPPFVEWMQGFPAGWTEGLPRTAALRCLGNAVVPQVASVVATQLERVA